jgi:hypothetical protein
MLVRADLSGYGAGEHDRPALVGIRGGHGAERNARQLGDFPADAVLRRLREQGGGLAAARADLTAHVLDSPPGRDTRAAKVSGRAVPLP